RAQLADVVESPAINEGGAGLDPAAESEAGADRGVVDRPHDPLRILVERRAGPAAAELPRVVEPPADHEAVLAAAGEDAARVALRGAHRPERPTLHLDRGRAR